MFDNIINFFKKGKKKELQLANSKDAAKERLHLVLMQDRANVSADFLDLMRQEIVEVIKKYIDIDEASMDVRLTNQENEDGTQGAPALYANIPIVNIKEEVRKFDKQEINTKNNEVEDSKKVLDTQNEEIISSNIDSNEDKIDEKDTKKEENNNQNSKIDEQKKDNNENKDNAENKSNESNEQKKDNTKNNENKKKTEDDRK